jgi:hypothetical protein
MDRVHVFVSIGKEILKKLPQHLAIFRLMDLFLKFGQFFGAVLVWSLSQPFSHLLLVRLLDSDDRIKKYPSTHD